MTLTYTLQVPSTGSQDLQVPKIMDDDKALFVDSNEAVKGQDGVSLVYGDVDAGAPLRARIFSSYNSSQDKTFATIQLEAFVKVTSTLTDDVRYLPHITSIKWEYPGKIPASPDDIAKLVGLTFNLFSKELTGTNGTPTSRVVQLIANGAHAAVLA